MVQRKRSLDADVGVVGLRIVDFGKHRDDSFRKLVHLHIPLLQNIDASLWRTAADMEENALLLQRPEDKLHCFLELMGGQAIQGGLLKHTVRLPIGPLFGRIYPLPTQSPLQIPLLTLLLVDESPAEIRAYQFLVPPSKQGVQHCAFATAQLENAGVVVYELGEEFLEQDGLNVPIVDLLLFELVAGVPVAFDVVVREVLWEAVLNQELFVFAEFGQFVLLLHIQFNQVITTKAKPNYYQSRSKSDSSYLNLKHVNFNRVSRKQVLEKLDNYLDHYSKSTAKCRSNQQSTSQYLILPISEANPNCYSKQDNIFQ